MKTKLLASLLPLLFLAPAARPQQPAPAKPVAYTVIVTLRPNGGAVAGSINKVFAFSLRPGGMGNLDSGDGVPVETAAGKYTYETTGASARCTLPEHSGAGPGQLEVSLMLSVKNVVAASSGQSSLHPVFRNASVAIDTIVPLGSNRLVASFPNETGKGTYGVFIRATPEPVAAQ